MLARVERFDAAVERFLALRDAVLSGTHFAQTLLALGLRILLQLESFVLRFDDGLAAQLFRSCRFASFTTDSASAPLASWMR